MIDHPSLWTSWGSLTRFLEGARLAFARERALWESLELHDRDSIKISVGSGVRPYKVSLAAHIAAMNDEETVYASVLIHTYALAEYAACRSLGTDARHCQGIEDWGSRLLEANNRDWDVVSDGIPGAVEIAVTRNAFAHGTREIDQAARARLIKVGATAPALGSRVTLTYEDLKTFRSRLHSLLKHGGLASKQATSASNQVS